MKDGARNKALVQMVNVMTEGKPHITDSNFSQLIMFYKNMY